MFFFLNHIKLWFVHVLFPSKRQGGFIFWMTLFSCPPAKSDKGGQDMEHLDFKIVVEPKDSPSFTVILVASSRQEKSAWTSDISQARYHASLYIFIYILISSFNINIYICFFLATFLCGLTFFVDWTAPCVSQCIDNIRCNGLMMNAFEDNSKVTVPQMIK